MGQNRPPVEFLISSSNISLEAFELARLNRAANLRKELRQLVDEWVESEVDSRIARWILECRRLESSGAYSEGAARIEPVRGRQLGLSFGSRSPDPRQFSSTENLSAGRGQRNLAPPVETNPDGASFADEEKISPSPLAAATPVPMPHQAQGEASSTGATSPAALAATGNPQDLARVNSCPVLPSSRIPERKEDPNLRALFDWDWKETMPGSLQQDAAFSTGFAEAKISPPRGGNRKQKQYGCGEHRRTSVSSRIDAVFDWRPINSRPAPAHHSRPPSQAEIACGVAAVRAC